MQVQKINNNKVKVILNSSDLLKKNIDIDSFLSNSEESQEFFFEILDLVEKKYSFDIEDNKAIVEAVSLDNNIFILTITKLLNDTSQISSSNIFVFNSLENIFELYYIIKKEKLYDLSKLYIYQFSNLYYVFVDESNLSFQSFLLEHSNFCNYSNSLKNILLEHGKRVNLN